MDTNSGFHTLKGYELLEDNKITKSMEDYLEMICRYAKQEHFVRINFLASRLNVRPSSASNMVYNLKIAGLLSFEKYGVTQPTRKGWELGSYLLYRHDVLNRFFCLLNQSEDELEQVEQIEHFMNKDTVINLEKLCGKLEQDRKDKK